MSPSERARQFPLHIGSLLPKPPAHAGTSEPFRCLLKRVASTRIFALPLSLLLLCQPCERNGRHAPARGYILDVATVPTDDPPSPFHQACGDARYIIATVVGDGRARLNGEPAVSLDQFIRRVREVLRYRAEKLVYVTGESEASWSDFLRMVDRIWPEADVVSIITPEVDRLARQQLPLSLVRAMRESSLVASALTRCWRRFVGN